MSTKCSLGWILLHRIFLNLPGTQFLNCRLQISSLHALFHKLCETAQADTLLRKLKLQIWTPQINGTAPNCTNLHISAPQTKRIVNLDTAHKRNCTSRHHKLNETVQLDTANWAKSLPTSQTVKLQVSNTTKCQTAIANCTKLQSWPQTEQNEPQTIHAYTSPHRKLCELQISTQQMLISTPQTVQNCKSRHHKIQNCTSWQRRLTSAKNPHQINDNLIQISRLDACKAKPMRDH